MAEQSSHGSDATAHTARADTFLRDRLPPRELWPVFDDAVLRELGYPAALNCARELLDRNAEVRGEQAALITSAGTWSYADLRERASRIAHVLVDDLGLRPGNRVLLRGPNTPMLIACWFAVLKAGGVCVCASPLLRAREIGHMVRHAGISLALTDACCAAELEEARTAGGRVAMRMAAGGATRTGADPLHHVLYYHADDSEGTLESLMAGKPPQFETVQTAADDVAIVAFTAGTAGVARAAVHFHRDLLAVADTFSRHLLRPRPDDVFCGSPSIALTFGLGGLVLFPMRAGAATVLLDDPTPRELLRAIRDFAATVCFTTPSLCQGMLEAGAADGVGRLRACVTAGEALPADTVQDWLRATGTRIINGISTTEMLHIFIAAGGDDVPPGSLGRPVPGYTAAILDDDGRELPRGTSGMLAVRGPTGCRYLDDPEAQQMAVRHGWNITGDYCVLDDAGCFWHGHRFDGVIITDAHRVGAAEIEQVLCEHEAVKECAVAVDADEDGVAMKAVVVVHEGIRGDEQLASKLLAHLHRELAPYKVPRAIEFSRALPPTAVRGPHHRA
jgi:2-aminobenzoate-CoA ligase